MQVTVLTAAETWVARLGCSSAGEGLPNIC